MPEVMMCVGGGPRAGRGAGVGVVQKGAAALEHEAEAARDGEVILDQQDTHGLLSSTTNG